MSTPTQKYRNRMRLSALFIIFPIYQFIKALLEHNNALLITMGILTIVYAGVLIYLYLRVKNAKNAKIPQNRASSQNSI